MSKSKTKFSIGDLVVVTEDAEFVNRYNKEYRYRKGYTFEIAQEFATHPEHGPSFAESNDKSYCTYEKFIELSPIHDSPLIKALK